MKSEVLQWVRRGRRGASLLYVRIYLLSNICGFMNPPLDSASFLFLCTTQSCAVLYIHPSHTSESYITQLIHYAKSISTFLPDYSSTS